MAQPQPSQEGEPDKAEGIRKLLKKGFSPRQIKEQFGYARTTMDEVAADFLKAEMDSEGSQAAARDELMPVKLGPKEIIPPEAIMRELGRTETRVVRRYWRGSPGASGSQDARTLCPNSSQCHGADDRDGTCGRKLTKVPKTDNVKSMPSLPPQVWSGRVRSYGATEKLSRRSGVTGRRRYTSRSPE